MLSSLALCMVLLAYANHHKRKIKYSTTYYAVANGASYYWTTMRPSGHSFACLATSQAAYCTILFTPSPTYTRVIDGALPPGVNYYTPDWENSIYRTIH